MPLPSSQYASPKTPIAGSVPGTYVRLLFDYLESQGLDASVILGERVPRQGQEPLYPAQRWRSMLALAARHLRDPVLGLHIGATITPAHLGPLGYVLLASNSVVTTMERYISYQRLVHDVSPVRSYVDGSRVVLEWDKGSRAMGLLANQCGLAALVQFARNITVSEAGANLGPVSVHFVEPAPDDVLPFETFFRCPVLFDQSATRIFFPAAFLELPLRQPDPALVAMLEQQVEALFAALPRKDSVEQDIRRLISHHVLRGKPELDLIAEQLHLSGRTLRRRLEERGWSFQGLLDDTRQRMAEDYLRDARLSLPEVALLLGYSEQSAFNRAFKKWTGMTPWRWRVARACLP
jgi:AraC-like DNA-binding protein